MSKNTIQVKLGAYKGIKVKSIPVTVTEEEVRAELRRACEMAGKREEKTDGAAAMGDQAVIDFKGYIDGEAFAGGEGADYPLTLGSGAFIPGFEEQIVGAKKGDQVRVCVTFPENYPAAELAGKEAVFEVTVKQIQTVLVPQLSDEVVAKVSKCSTVSEFTEYVREEIRKNRERENATARENQILEKIILTSEIHIPDPIVDERAQALKHNLIAQLRNSGNTLEQYLQYNGITEEQYEQYVKNDAMTMLRGQAVLGEIARAECMTCTKEELDQEIASMAKAYQMEDAQIRRMVGENGMAMLAEDVLSRKALDFIVEQSVEE